VIKPINDIMTAHW